jgi:UPF0755 protein
MNPKAVHPKRSFSRSRLKATSIYLATLAVLTAVLYVNSMLSPNATTFVRERIVTIPRGASTSVVASILKNEGLIKSEFFFKAYTSLFGIDQKIQAGVYRFKTDMQLKRILNDLATGNVVLSTVKFTVPEGLELKEIALKLSKEGIVDFQSFIEAAKSDYYDYWFLKELKPGTTLEGYLFPDTYEIYRGEDERQIIDRMLRQFDDKFKPEYKKILRERKLSVHDAVTLASIVEREAQVSSERPIISAVFYNRLKKGWNLQSCVTVQYALGERKRTLLFSDLEIDSPYNTYRYPGLPPGPIANPGEASLEAVIYPVESDYMFFYANGDGTHTFTRTYTEHLDVINQMR